MYPFLSLIVLIALFIAEFVLNLLAHAMILRLAMCHTLVFLLFNICQVFDLLKRTKGLQEVKFLRAKVKVDTFVTFLHAVAYVLVFGFVVVNILHSLQLIVHRHDMDVHHGLVVLLVGGFDFLIKLFLWPLLDCGFNVETKWGVIRKGLFYETASILLLVIAALRCISKSNRVLILTLDPSLTIVACLVIFLSGFDAAKDFLYTLLLAAPRHLDVEELSSQMRLEFPQADVHDLHVWRESNKRVVGSVHVRLPYDKSYRALTYEIHAFFHRYGISKVVLQPEFEQNSMERRAGSVHESIAESRGSKPCILPCPC